MKNRYYDPVDLRGDYRHMRSFGLTNKDDYVDLSNKFVKEAKYMAMDVYTMVSGAKELQFIFFAPEGYTVINHKGYIKGCFKQRDIDKCFFNNKEKVVQIEGYNNDR